MMTPICEPFLLEFSSSFADCKDQASYVEVRAPREMLPNRGNVRRHVTWGHAFVTLATAKSRILRLDKTFSEVEY